MRPNKKFGEALKKGKPNPDVVRRIEKDLGPETDFFGISPSVSDRPRLCRSERVENSLVNLFRKFRINADVVSESDLKKLVLLLEQSEEARAKKNSLLLIKLNNQITEFASLLGKTK